jgi:DNA repair protein SbcC/Rad50
LRPLRLVMEAFGAYAEPQVVDFRVLGERRLFLVHGPTGAGKTTILDAMCFALYGDATGPERDGKGFRSDFVGAERSTSVSFDFSVGERVYRVTRQPEQERAKLRGEGTTVSPPAATLWDRTGLDDDEQEGRVLAAKSMQVTEAIVEILGFRSEQFRQVIVLPQGRFRDLLLANSRDREDILKQLFDTAWYGRIEEGLKQRAREQRVLAESLRTQRATLLEQAACADEAEVDALIARVEAERVECERRAVGRQEQSAAAAQALERARAVHAQFARLAEARARLEALTAREPEFETRREQLAVARRAAGLVDLPRVLAAWREALGMAERALVELRAGESKALQAAAAEGDRAERARHALEQAHAALAALRNAREQAAAALLARELRPGEPCPVCGSTEHPRPATGDGEIPGEAALEAAERQAVACETQWAAADRARQQAERDAAVKSASEFAAAESRRNEARRDLADTERDWQARLTEAGFATERDYLDARRTDAELDREEAELRRFEHDQVAARTRLEEARDAVEGLAPPELAALERAATDAALAHRAAQTESGRLASRRETLEGLRDALADTAGRFAVVEGRHRVLGTLAGVANGDNSHRVSLQRFVLASRLDDVLAAAGKRLSLMSRGRYLLRRNLDVQARRGPGGLELEVDDAYTAKTRPVATLSGGESFQAALALALGLAEVVQAYAGGIRLDTIFIDEGFGSLDPEALDLAINALVDLQQSGRLVGVISHVPELRERIDVRLEVVAGRTGSRTLFHLP